MSDTLKALSNTLNQLSTRPGLKSAAGIWVAGALALTLAASPRESVASEADVDQPATTAAPTPQALKDLGATAQGLFGNLARRAQEAATSAQASVTLGASKLTVNAATVGEQLKQAVAGTDPKQTAVDRFMASVAAKQPSTEIGKKPLTPQLLERMGTLVTQAAAAKLVQQELRILHQGARLEAATQPKNARLKAAEAAYGRESATADRTDATAQAELQNAIEVMQQQGFAVHSLRAAAAETASAKMPLPQNQKVYSEAQAQAMKLPTLLSSRVIAQRALEATTPPTETASADTSRPQRQR
jgi:hypothetical protein